MSILQNDGAGQDYIVYRKEDGEKTIIAHAKGWKKANKILMATVRKAKDNAEYGFERIKQNATYG